MDAIAEAASAASIHADIAAMPMGYETGSWLWILFAIAVIGTIVLAFAPKNLDDDDNDSPSASR